MSCILEKLYKHVRAGDPDSFHLKLQLWNKDVTTISTEAYLPQGKRSGRGLGWVFMLDTINGNPVLNSEGTAPRGQWKFGWVRWHL